jgi:hypothetical protein
MTFSVRVKPSQTRRMPTRSLGVEIEEKRGVVLLPRGIHALQRLREAIA